MSHVTFCSVLTKVVCLLELSHFVLYALARYLSGGTAADGHRYDSGDLLLPVFSLVTGTLLAVGIKRQEAAYFFIWVCLKCLFSCLCFLVCGTLAGLYLLVALRAMTPHPELESLEPEKMLAICGVSLAYVVSSPAVFSEYMTMKNSFVEEPFLELKPRNDIFKGKRQITYEMKPRAPVSGLHNDNALYY